MRVAFTNLGCKLNQAEIDDLARSFLRAGHEVAPSIEHADVHVVNSCTVTHVAARDSRKIARRANRLRPGIKTILTGCYVSADPAEAARLAGVDLVVPNAEKENLLERFHAAFPDFVPSTEGPEPSPGSPYLPVGFGPSRPLVKVEDGCNMKCSFCIIPITRGRQRSRDPGEIIAEIQHLEATGFREVVVTGVQISSYRWDGKGLVDLVRSMLDATQYIRIRLTSIAPWEFDSGLLDLLASRRLCRHFHLSLQSGCATTLRRMRRPYSPQQFHDLVSSIRSIAPRAAITTDIIVGFPGETDRDFAVSSGFAQRLGFARIHVFPYSERPATPAAGFADAVSPAARKGRMERMLRIASEARLRFHECNLGSEVEVLWEDHRGGESIGMSDNYIRVRARTNRREAGRLSRVLLATSDERGVSGRVVDRSEAGGQDRTERFPTPPSNMLDRGGSISRV